MLDNCCAICGAKFDELTSFGVFAEYDDRKCHKVCVEMDRVSDQLITKILNVLDKK